MCWKHLPHLIESKALLLIRCTTNARIRKKENMLPSKSSLSFTFQPQVNTSMILYTSNSIEGSASDALSQAKWARTSPQNAPCLETSLPSIKKSLNFQIKNLGSGSVKRRQDKRDCIYQLEKGVREWRQSLCPILTLAIDGLHLS